ncbi:MAG: efflux RND transporter periplasmic adaptor subunit [Lachnospiraceae bacterium]|nr:efflux RND transporter periplasmic adaptor subunit [Lachnospiraceae bacterium]
MKIGLKRKKQELENTQLAETVKKPKKKKKVRVIVCIILVVIIVIMAVSCSMAPEAGALVTTTVATRGDLQESISTSGTVSSEHQEVIFAQVGGKLEAVNISAGDDVKAGDILIGYDMDEAEDRLKQASLQQDKSEASYQAIMADNSKSQAKLSEANTNLGVLEQQITDWKAHLKNLEEELSDYQRETGNNLAAESFHLTEESTELQDEIKSLDKTAPDYQTKLDELQKELSEVSEDIAYNQFLQQTYNSSDYVAELQKEISRVSEELAGFEEYKAKMESQKASSENVVMDSYDKEQYVADKELSVMSYKTAEEAYEIAKQGVVAGFDGIVMECSAVQGATITEGMQLLTLASSEELKVTFSASKHDVEKLEEGQKAKVTISGNTYDGIVNKIDRMATMNASNTPMVGVEVHITNPDNKIILGMEARLEIYTNKVENALLIPVEAINADKDGDFLYIAENGMVVRKPIVCGISSDTHTEVIEGITEQDEIIVSSLTGVEEGMPVTIMPEE